MLSDKEGSNAMPKDLLLQVQCWIVKQLQSLESQASSDTRDRQCKEGNYSEREDATLGSVAEETETANIIIALEQLQFYLCDQHLSIADLESSSVRNQEDNAAAEIPAAIEDIACRPLVLDIAEAEQQRLKDTGAEEPIIEDVPSHIKEQWRELKAEMLHRCEERIMACIAEEEAYRKVRVFAHENGDQAYTIAGEYIDVAARSAELQRELAKAEVMWKHSHKNRLTRQPIQQVRKEIVEEDQEMRKKYEDFRARARAWSIAENKERESFKGKTPGYYATKYKNATEPCNKWHGPYQCWRYEKYCNVCNLTGISRTGDCPNFFQHWKWQQGLEEAYEYP